MVITELSIAKDAGDDQLSFNISLEKMRKVNIGKTVLANVTTNSGNATKDAKGKELQNKTANKTSEGSKNSGDTTKASTKIKTGSKAGDVLYDTLGIEHDTTQPE